VTSGTLPGPPRRLVFLGPPAAGKGTQAAELARELGLAHLSTGDLLRAAVAEGSDLGRAADDHMRAGRLVPDDLVLRILGERLARPDATSGFILDGFPRTLAQAEALGRITDLDAVVSFDVDPKLLVERMAGRRSCPKCGAVYHLTSNPPREAGRCDRDGTGLIQRPDDRAEALEVRLRAYHDQTAPLREYYLRRGLLRSLDASGSPTEVAARLRRLLAEPSGRPPDGRRPSKP